MNKSKLKRASGRSRTIKDASLLDEIGGPEYLSSLLSFVPTSANADYYIDIIREKHILRQIIAICGRATTQCYGNPEEIDALLDDIEQQIFAITNQSVQLAVRPTKQLVMEAIEEIEQLYEPEAPSLESLRVLLNWIV